MYELKVRVLSPETGVVDVGPTVADGVLSFVLSVAV